MNNISFKDFIVEETIEIIYENLDKLADKDFDLLIETLLDEECKLEESLSVLARKKRSLQMKKMHNKLQKAKAKKLLKGPTKADIEAKARKAAVGIIRTKLAKGKTELSRGEKERIEDKIAKMGKVITKIAKKQLTTVRKHEKERRHAAKEKAKTGINDIK